MTKNEIQDLYRKRAANYDLSANLYYLIGFREAKYRKRAVSALGLEPGDTVVEIGCGTGLNFSYLLNSVGETGTLIGVDLTNAMLEKAGDRLQRKGWRNVQLVHMDAAVYEFPSQLKGVISTFALTLVPEYKEVIEHAFHALEPDGRFVILDLKKPDRWPLWLVKVGVFITKPFGVSLGLAERKPWQVMDKYFARVTVTEVFGGFVYIAVGEKT
jgi:demethylmenaquinone methyltransferase/2-methoxy-6-polyprenyl-1,4-benzoquinol methylase